MRHIWDWKKKAEKMFGKGNVKVFRRNGVQYAYIAGPIGDPSYWKLNDATHCDPCPELAITVTA